MGGKAHIKKKEIELWGRGKLRERSQKLRQSLSTKRSADKGKHGAREKWGGEQLLRREEPVGGQRGL